MSEVQVDGLRSDGPVEMPLPTAPLSPRLRGRPPTVDLALVALVGLAEVLDLAPTPVWVRSVLCLPILIGAPGYAALRTMTGLDRRASTPGGAAPIWALTVLFGLLAVLADVLLISALQLRLTTENLVAGDAGITVVLLASGRLILGRWAQAHAASEGRRRLRSREDAVAVAVVVAVAGLLVGAVTIARAIQPSTRAPYVGLAATGTAATGRLGSVPGAQVAIGWSLRGYDGFVGGQPVATVTIGTLGLTGAGPGVVAPSGTSVRTGAGTTSPGVVAGTTTFTAPTTGGDYRISLNLTDGPGEPLRIAVDLTVAAVTP